MGDALIPVRWRYRAGLLALAFGVAFLRLLPVDAGDKGLPGPDLVLLFVLAWVIRRPDFVPVLLIAPIFLMADVLFMRPLGLWTAACVIGTEVLRARGSALRDQPFLAEWALVAAVLGAMTLGNAALLAVFAVSGPPLGLTLFKAGVTILAYPLVVLISTRIMGVRRPLAPGGDGPRFGT